MPLQWPTWALVNPPSGQDGRRWSAKWFIPVAVDAWARQAPEVADAIAELMTVERCSRVEVVPLSKGGESPLDLLALGSLEQSGVYRKPSRTVSLVADDALGRRISMILQLQGPVAPLDAPVDALSHRLAGAVSPRPTFTELAQAQEPLLAMEVVRRLGAQDLKNSAGVPLRRRLLDVINRAGTLVRTPRQQGPAFTDMSPEELGRVVSEAERLAAAVQKKPDSCWPLLPDEFARLCHPPTVGQLPLDYEARLQELAQRPDGVASLRAPTVLAHDLTLMRLGYDPDDEKKRVALRVALHRRGPA